MAHYAQEEKHIREENLRLQRRLQMEMERREALCRHLSESESRFVVFLFEAYYCQLLIHCCNVYFFSQFGNGRRTALQRVDWVRSCWFPRSLNWSYHSCEPFSDHFQPCSNQSTSKSKYGLSLIFIHLKFISNFGIFLLRYAELQS